MAKHKHKKKKGGNNGIPAPTVNPEDYFDATKIAPTPPGQLFDPNSGYGRTKDTLWPSTEAGRNFATNNPDLYLQYMYGRAGGLGNNPIYGGMTQFGDWLANQRADEYQNAWRASNMASGGHLGFAEYMNSVGWGADNPGIVNSLTSKAAAPQNTGNPFTSSSLAPAAPTMPAAPGGGGHHSATNPYSGMPAMDAINAQDSASLSGKKLRGGSIKGGGSSPSTTGGGVLGGPPLPSLTGVGGLDRDRLAYNSLVPQQRGINSALGFKPGRWAVF